MPQERKQLSKLGHALVQLLQILLDTPSVCIMVRHISQYLLLKIWLDTNSVNFLLLVLSVLTLVTSSFTVSQFYRITEIKYVFLC
jgi:hypothetical protein